MQTRQSEQSPSDNVPKKVSLADGGSLANTLGSSDSQILAVLGIFLIQLFPNWTACSPITYTYGYLLRICNNLNLVQFP